MINLNLFELVVPAQAVEDELPDDVIDDRKERNTDDHADEAPQTAEKQDGKQDPEAGKAGGVAEDLRADDVAVQLLQDQDEEDEPDGLDRVLDQNQQGGRDGTDERAEEGDNVRHANDDRDEQCARELDDDADDVAENTDDGGIQNFAVDESTEHFIGVEDFLHDEICPMRLDDAVQNHLGLLRELLAAGEQVNRDDDANDEVLDDRHDAQHADAHTAEDVLHGGKDVLHRGDEGVLDPRIQVSCQLSIGAVDEIHKGLVVCDESQL